MNIALIGAPSSGKSKLAVKLALELDKRNKGNVCTYIVDNYIPEIEKETNLALGQITDYMGNLYVALGRYARERVGRETQEHVITCGTLIETAVYFAMHIVAMNKVLPEAEKDEYAPRADAMMRMLSCLYSDSFTYDQLFYLPAVEADEDNGFIDKQIQAGLAGFKLAKAVTLPDEDRVAVALESL